MPVKKHLTKRRLVCSAIFRFSLIPLALMCCMPRLQPILSGEVWPIFLIMLLGFSNGYYGCLPLVLAPSTVAPRFRELCGNTMMLAFAFAIACGTFTSYGLDLLLGPHLQVAACSEVDAMNSSSVISRHIGVPPIPTA
ncbi:equilibrative nucleoside transporter 4-like [Elysia marginata]|uniref:Equilibrative nucleoside transporter 4-like n=1 Tax=Elysia marginata TaxID=1093978 RepID=A0AAV4JK27_9GAST|nr:equilibrative nucleoside transporter 4-like [Elysia marginata]